MSQCTQLIPKLKNKYIIVVYVSFIMKIATFVKSVIMYYTLKVFFYFVLPEVVFIMFICFE